MTAPGSQSGEPRVTRKSLTISSLRAQNRSAVLRQLIVSGSATRANIAAKNGLSSASATNIVCDLVAEGLVADGGLLASQGGRPSSIVEVVADGAYFLGADVGERGVAVELFDLRMTRIDQEFRGSSTEESPDTIGRDLTEAVEALRIRQQHLWPRVMGVGLALPGIVETGPAGAQTLYAESLGWPPIAIRPLLRHELPLVAENGAKAQAKAEQWFGAARGVDYAVVALLGRGVGLGVITNGEILRGFASSASEWGHISIDRTGPVCRCGRRGCVEVYLGAPGILDRWADLDGGEKGSDLAAICDLLRAADSGHPAAVQVVDETVANLGVALGGLVSLYNPQRVVIGGWVGMQLMHDLAPRIEDATRASALRRPAEQFSLVPSSFGGETVAIGAAILPLELLVMAPRSIRQSRAARSLASTRQQ